MPLAGLGGDVARRRGLGSGWKRRLRTVPDVEANEEAGVVSNLVFGWLMWILIVLANGYAIVTLALGKD